MLRIVFPVPKAMAGTLKMLSKYLLDEWIKFWGSWTGRAYAQTILREDQESSEPAQ